MSPSGVAPLLRRSRWLPAELWLAVAIAVVTDLMLRLAGDAEGGMIAVLEVMLVITPLLGLLLGVTRVHHARDVIELMLAQPVSRRRLFALLWRQLTLPLTGAVMVGVLAPLAWQGLLGVVDPALSYGTVVGLGLLTLASQSVGIGVALSSEDRVRAVLVAIVLWLVVAVLWDGILLALTLLTASRPLEIPLLVLLSLNLVDLVRVVLLLGSDAAAMLGYTGAAVQRALGTGTGRAVLAAVILLWVTIPVAYAAWRFERKDF